MLNYLKAVLIVSVAALLLIISPFVIIIASGILVLLGIALVIYIIKTLMDLETNDDEEY